MRLLLAGRQGGQRLFEPPDPPARFLDTVERWCRAEAGELLISMRRRDDDGDALLALRLHPGAEEVIIVAAGQGRIVVTANTSAVGPGYHQYLCALFQRLGDTLDVRWLEDNRTADVGDPTGYFHTGDKAPLEQKMLDWVGTVASRALEMREGGGQVSLAIADGHTFHAEGALLTPLGPRDDAWLRKVKADPAQGRDLFAWWDAPSDARQKLGRALILLWTQMVWRPPLFDAERQLFREVARLLESAYREEPSLDYPWVEWREVLAYLGVGGTLAEDIAHRAVLAAGEDRPRIGYRRGDVEVALGGGWSICVPGRLAEETLPHGGWVARDHSRSIQFTPLEPRAHPAPSLEGVGGERLHHRGERVESQAALKVAEEGGSALVAVIQTQGLVPDLSALCTIRFEDPEDADWAQRTWRSLDCRARPALAQ